MRFDQGVIKWRIRLESKSSPGSRRFALELSMNSIAKHVSSIRVPLTVFFLLVFCLAGIAIWSHVQLPDRMAVHFDGSGTPDRWSGKWEMTGVMLGVAVLYSLIFGVFSIYLPKLPARLWNLPRKDYWLAPERASETLTSFGRDYLWMGILMLLLMGYVQWDVFQANTVRPDHNLTMNIWLVLGVVVLFIVMAIRMAVKFYRVPSST